MLTMALPKGRVLPEALELLKRIGWPIPEDITTSRRLIFDLTNGHRLILTKPVDVPVYVQYGVADVGMVGKDVLLEEAADVYELLDLGIGHCRLSIAALAPRSLQKTEAVCAPEKTASIPEQAVLMEGVKADSVKRNLTMLRVATKYPRLSRQFFAERGEQVEIVTLSGSIELAPLLGLAERIVDIVSTGQTLRENGLVELETISEITTRLIASRTGYRFKQESIVSLVYALESLKVV
ncbi:MAG: ATP phosphoribosyltransferase [Candidatus Carbobacillus altaicus]|uniref:ATP phosphoribosyltransferase n=1 Tax=Candidatus Carbonibacillus altaicus TaxID=2163959 RepID=A0A2R6XZY1_9BACL|nr:MAG: ATP phosphoribosyltransferase [Candidatus Carbobacillus altaicus]